MQEQSRAHEKTQSIHILLNASVQMDAHILVGESFSKIFRPPVIIDADFDDSSSHPSPRLPVPIGDPSIPLFKPKESPGHGRTEQMVLRAPKSPKEPGPVECLYRDFAINLCNKMEVDAQNQDVDKATSANWHLQRMKPKINSVWWESVIQPRAREIWATLEEVVQ